MPSDNLQKALNNLRKTLDEQTPSRGTVATPQKLHTTPKQTTATQLDFFPQAKTIVRPELNVAKFADFIFISPRSKLIGEIRHKSWNKSFTSNETGELTETTASITVNPAIFPAPTGDEIRRSPTITSYKYFLAIIQLWEAQGRPADGCVMCSGKDIFRILGIKAGKASYQIFVRELDVLTGSRLIWQQAFITKKESTSEKKNTGFISGYSHSYKGDREATEIFKSLTQIAIHHDLLPTLRRGLTKPVAFRTLISITSHDSARLYTRLETIMSQHTFIELNSTTLLQELGIVGERYKKNFLRKQKLEEFKSDLNGKYISSGVLSLSIQKSAQDDWKLVVRKEPRPKKNRLPNKPANPPEIIDDLSREMYEFVGMPKTPQEGYPHTLAYTYATNYPEQVVRHAISVYKADAMREKTTRNKQALFTTILHTEVHRAKLNWIGNCNENKGGDCPYNQPELPFPHS